MIHYIYIYIFNAKEGGPQAQSAYMLQEPFLGNLSPDLSFYKTSITFFDGVLHHVYHILRWGSPSGHYPTSATHTVIFKTISFLICLSGIS